MIYIKLFISFLKVGLFSIGGGYASIPIIQSQVVEKFAWITLDEFSNLITIAEMTPGPIAVNCATFVGLKIAGILGAIIATLATILPAIFIVSILTCLYFKYKNIDYMKTILSTLRPTIIALIASAGLSILINAITKESSLDITALVLFAGCFISIRKTKINPIFAMITTGFIYMLINLIL